MPWARFDDKFDDDPDCDIVGDVGICLFVCAITWSSRKLTDGFIPTSRVCKLAGGNDPEAIAGLTDPRCRWWVAVEGGYQIRSFLKYNPTKEQVIADRERERLLAEQRALAGRNGGMKSAETRAAKRAEAEALKAQVAQLEADMGDDNEACEVTDDHIEQVPQADCQAASGFATPTPQAKPAFGQAKSQAKPAFGQAKFEPPVSRIPYPGIRNPDPPTPPDDPQPRSPGPGGGGGGQDSQVLSQVLEQLLRFAPSQAEAEALIERLGPEALRWEIAALDWRIENRRAEDAEIRRPWLYLLDCLRRELPLPAAIKARRDAAAAEAKREREAEDRIRRAEAAAALAASQQAEKDAAKIQRQRCDEAWERIHPDEQESIQTEVEEAMCRENIVRRGHREKHGPGWTQRPDCISVFKQRRDEILEQRGLVHDNEIIHNKKKTHGELEVSGLPLRLVTLQRQTEIQSQTDASRQQASEAA